MKTVTQITEKSWLNFTPPKQAAYFIIFFFETLDHGFHTRWEASEIFLPIGLWHWLINIIIINNRIFFIYPGIDLSELFTAFSIFPVLTKKTKKQASVL